MADTNILKDNLSGSVPTEISNELIKNIVTQSTAFGVCRHVPMISNKKTLPVLTDTGSAYWVKEGEKIGSSIMAFDYPELEAQKLAVIVPVTREKINDSVLGVLGEIQASIADAFARAIDKAIFFGTDSPFSKNLLTVATTKKVDGTGKIDIDISDSMGKVEADDYTVTGIVTHNGMKNTFRKLRDTNGNALVIPGGVTGSQIYNTPIYIPQSKAWDKTKAEAILGDYTKAVIGTREDMQYQVLDQATITVGSTNINLAENDLVAIKCTMRFGFNVINAKAFSCVLPKATTTNP